MRVVILMLLLSSCFIEKKQGKFFSSHGDSSVCIRKGHIYRSSMTYYSSTDTLTTRAERDTMWLIQPKMDMISLCSRCAGRRVIPYYKEKKEFLWAIK